jgi:hypothetical protein
VTEASHPLYMSITTVAPNKTRIKAERRHPELLTTAKCRLPIRTYNVDIHFNKHQEVSMIQNGRKKNWRGYFSYYCKKNRKFSVKLK